MSSNADDWHDVAAPRANTRYLAGADLLLRRLANEGAGTIEDAARVLSCAWRKGGILAVARTNHVLHDELIRRAGGPIAVAELEEDAEASLIALDGTQLDRVVYRLTNVRQDDVVLVHVNAGTSRHAVDLALQARAVGARSIALNQLAYERASEARHPSGKRLADVADVTVDLGGEIGDAAIAITGLDAKVAPTSGVTGTAAAWAIIARACEILAGEGLSVPIFQSMHEPGAPERNDQLVRNWRTMRAGRSRQVVPPVLDQTGSKPAIAGPSDEMSFRAAIDLDPGVWQCPARTWSTNSLVVMRDGHAIVVDPTFTQEEIGRIKQLVADAERVTLLITHSHFDHTCGIGYFPEAEVVMGTTTHDWVAGGQPERQLRLAATEWGMPWPIALRCDHVVEPGARFMRGPFTIDVVESAGNSGDGVAYVFLNERVLASADFLSAACYPVPDTTIAAAAATCRTLLAALDRYDLRWVVPGHGPAMHPGHARIIGNADLRYLRALQATAQDAKSTGISTGAALAALHDIEPPRPVSNDFAIYEPRSGNARTAWRDAIEHVSPSAPLRRYANFRLGVEDGL